MRAMTILGVLALTLPARAESVWQIDPAHSSVQFSIRHMTISNVRGQFTKLTGTVRGDESDPTHAQVEATIDTASIDTHEPKRDEHLRSPDFLDVATHPTVTFKSKKIEKVGDGRWRMSGDLTLHGVTREVVVEVEGPTPPTKDPRGSIRAGASATAKIDRRDFGIVWNKALEGGGLTVGNEVAITIDVEGVKQP